MPALAVNSHNMEHFEHILFSKVNLVNAMAVLWVFMFDAMHQISLIATDLTPIVAVTTGLTVGLYNMVKTWKEFKRK